MENHNAPATPLRLLCLRVLSSVLLVSAPSLAVSPLKCPLPEGAGSATRSTCSRYSACVWFDAAAECRLSDQVGYVVESHTDSAHRAQRHVHLKKRSDVTMFGGDVTRLLLTETRYDPHRLRVTFRDPDRRRYEVPLALDLPHVPTALSESTYRVRYASVSDLFRMDFLQHGAQAVSMASEFIYSDQFIEATLLLPGAEDIYGMGENNHDSFRHDLSAAITWPIFTRDRAPGDGHENLYGAHPFFVAILDDSGRSCGVLFINSNAMEYKVFRVNGTTPAVTFRTTGGILDMLVFFGDSPLDVVRYYQQTIGLPLLPAYWSLGFQLSRFGYTSTDDIRRIHSRNRIAGIPQDVQYSDIDYMDNEKDFTLNMKKFGDFGSLVGQLREQGVHVTLIYDPAIPTDFGRYPPVKRGIAADAFVKWMNSSLVPADQCEGCRDYIVGFVWPRNKTLFPDFFQQSTVDWWTDEMMRFSKIAGGPDGFWIDMNEPSNFGTNMEKPFNWPPHRPPWSLKCPHNALDDPPYPTLYVTRDPTNDCKRISDKTLCMSSKHVNDVFPVPIAGKPETASVFPAPRWTTGFSEIPTELEFELMDLEFNKILFNTDFRLPQDLLHYDVHNLYGWSETHATRRAMDTVLGGARGQLVSRSTYPGSGRWGSHWTGDNTSRWKDLKRSIVGIFEFSMFGIPHVGADICGFNGNTTEHLCLRWMQLGAFYPFCRNHNTDDGFAQDPAAWPSVAAASKQALHMRYYLLPYLYTLFWRAATAGDMVVRPAAFEWPTVRSLRGLDTQFFWGGALMVAPVLTEEEMTSVNVTFPPGRWYDLRYGTLASSSRGVTSRYYGVPMDSMIPVFARGGFILPAQPSGLTTDEARKNSFQLLVFGTVASGELFWDDGHVKFTAATQYYFSSFRYRRGVLKILAERPDTRSMASPYVDTVIFYGVSSPPKHVTADGSIISRDDVKYDAEKKLLTVIVHMHLGKPHTLELNM